MVGGIVGARLPSVEARGKLLPSEGSMLEEMLSALMAISKSFST